MFLRGVLVPNKPVTVPRWEAWWVLFVGVVLIAVVSFGVVRTINLVNDVKIVTHQGQETNVLVKQCVVDGVCGPASNRAATAKLIAGINARLDCLAGMETIESYNACTTSRLAEIEKLYADIQTPTPSTSPLPTTTTTLGG
jgi:hypothetical protein